jgi:hypothetical protein
LSLRSNKVWVVWIEVCIAATHFLFNPLDITPNHLSRDFLMDVEPVTESFKIDLASSVGRR